METLDFDYKKSFKTLKSNEKRVCKLFFMLKYLHISFFCCTFAAFLIEIVWKQLQKLKTCYFIII